MRCGRIFKVDQAFRGPFGVPPRHAHAQVKSSLGQTCRTCSRLQTMSSASRSSSTSSCLHRPAPPLRIPLRGTKCCWHLRDKVRVQHLLAARQHLHQPKDALHLHNAFAVESNDCCAYVPLIFSTTFVRWFVEFSPAFVHIRLRCDSRLV